MLKLYQALVKDYALKYLEKWKLFESIQREMVHVDIPCTRYSDHCAKYWHFLQMSTDGGQNMYECFVSNDKTMYV
jgi:hypothetical protein